MLQRWGRGRFIAWWGGWIFGKNQQYIFSHNLRKIPSAHAYKASTTLETTPMLTSAALFLIQAVFDLYIFVVLLRFLLQTIHADYFNPLAQFSIKFTQWIVKPLQKIIPEIKGID